MPRPSPSNERVKRDYRRYLRQAQGLHQNTIEKASAAIEDFEAFTGGKDFKTFRSEQAEDFKCDLRGRTNKYTREPLSYSTLLHKLDAVGRFFRWLSTQTGYKSLSAADAEYFNLPAREKRIARATKEKPVPTMEQIIQVLQRAPIVTELDLRDRAVIALIVLTGARDGAVVSLKLKHVDLLARKLMQPAREVNTKAAKSMETWFFPVPEFVVQIVKEWLEYLKQNHFGPEDPLFPSTLTGRLHERFAAMGLARTNWKTTGPVRRIFKTAFARADLSYCNPHSFRSTLAVLGEKVCRTTEELKAWSQNLGHDSIHTTLISYGRIATPRQGELMKQFVDRQAEAPSMTIDLAVLKEAIEKVMKQGCSGAMVAERESESDLQD